ncbi:MAG: glycosyltransferase [Flavobacteriaceae bacterium]|nr:glycosyltransferase [Flavobacteriaceae bacterium]
MKILLVGEYNSSHKTLKDGLVSLGHEVTVVGMGDGFKKRKVDVNFSEKYKKGLPLWINKVLFKLFNIDLHSNSIEKQFFRKKELFSNNDIVQLINEHSFLTQPKTEKKLLDFIFQNNKNVFLLSCGLDHISVKFAQDKKYRYSILTPYFEGKRHKKNYYSITKYLTEPFTKLHHFIFENIKGIIASDLDYHVPLDGHPKYLGMVPNPIDVTKFAYQFPEIKDKVVIFHGINRNNYYKKGNYLFEEALEILRSKHPDKIEIVTVESVPYETYINLFNDAHILLDQVFAYDQGFNALEAMAKGKVVLTGAEKEWLDYFNLQEDTVAINALPDAQKIADKLEWLILNPEKMREISLNARKFIEEEHDHIKMAQRYFDLWSSKI